MTYAAGGSVHPMVRTARLTGLLYLALAVLGGVGFLAIRPQLFVPGDAAATLGNLVEREALARLAIALELGAVISQGLVALWFFRLFRAADDFAAAAVAAFGFMNGVALLGSSAFLATALQVAHDSSLAADAAPAVQLLYAASGNFWAVGNVFFGLWLVPMGWLVVRSGWMPRALGWVLIAGGTGYMLNAFLLQLLPGQFIGGALAWLAAVGEFWMIGYLLLRGVRPVALEQEARGSAQRVRAGTG